MNRPILSWVSLCALILSACEHSALWRIKTKSEEIEQRIPVKEQELQQLQHSNLMLQEETKKLTADLSNKKLTLNELYGRLEQYKRTIARLEAVNESERQKKIYLDQQIRESQRRINVMRNNKTMPDREKQRQVEELQSEIRKRLEMGLD